MPMLLCNPGKPLKRKILIHGFDFDSSTSFLWTAVFLFYSTPSQRTLWEDANANNKANGTYNILNVVKINIVFMDALEMQ